MRSADHANESNATFILVEFNLSRLEPKILNRTLPNDLEPLVQLLYWSTIGFESCGVGKRDFTHGNIVYDGQGESRWIWNFIYRRNADEAVLVLSSST